MIVQNAIKCRLDRGSIRSSLRDGLSTPYRLSKEHCLNTVHIRDLHLFLPALNLSILDGGILIMGNKYIEHAGLPHVLPLAVHQGLFLVDK